MRPSSKMLLAFACLAQNTLSLAQELPSGSSERNRCPLWVRCYLKALENPLGVGLLLYATPTGKHN